MNETNFIKYSLSIQGLPICDTDIPHIHAILFTINETETSLNLYPNLNNKVPVTVVDKELFRCQT